jgi:hypothetical protein
LLRLPPCFRHHRDPAPAPENSGNADETSITFTTPGIAIAFAASNEATPAPTTGAILTAAYSMPGTRASMPNSALPLTLAGVSRRGTGWPIRRNSLGVLRRTSPGSMSAPTTAARAASSP